jgi:hypothetical protein
MDLLTTYTNDSELRTITAPPLISTTLHTSLLQALSLFQPGVSSLDVSWERFLTIAIPLLPCSSLVQNWLSEDLIR